MSRGASILLTVAVVLLFCGATTVTGLVGKEIVKNEAEEKSKCYITYVLNGGTNSDKNPAYFRSGEGVQLEDPAYDGYVFTGWYSDSGLTERIDYIAKGTTTDVTVYAGWMKSLVGTLLTYDVSGGYTNTSTSADYTMDGLMTIEYLDYNKSRGYQTKLQTSLNLDTGNVDIDTSREIVLRNTARSTEWENDEEDPVPVRGEDCVISTFRGAMTCEKWTYEKIENGVRTVQTQYINDEIVYVIENVETEDTETMTIRGDLTGIDDQTKTVVTKTFNWSYDHDDNPGTPLREYSITVNFSFSDFIDYGTDDIQRGEVIGPNAEQHNLDFVTVNDKYVREVARKILEKANSDANTRNDADRLGMILAFTQYIPYQHDYDFSGQTEYWKYPVETLMDGEGDCEDTSILFCALAKAAGYDCCIILYPDHMAAGVNNTECSGFGFVVNAKNYYYCETTATGWTIGANPGYPYNSEYYLDYCTVVP